ncbi:MAG: GlsB/YeaQ/YmgE family stress response membrane protein [Reyranellaceae bacterium]
MTWLWVIIIGFIVGLIAKFLTPGRDVGGFILTTLVGIGGSVLASWAGQTMGWYAPGQPAGFIAAVVGAVVLLLILRVIRRG